MCDEFATISTNGLRVQTPLLRLKSAGNSTPYRVNRRKSAKLITRHAIILESRSGCTQHAIPTYILYIGTITFTPTTDVDVSYLL